MLILIIVGIVWVVVGGFTGVVLTMHDPKKGWFLFPAGLIFGPLMWIGKLFTGRD